MSRFRFPAPSSRPNVNVLKNVDVSKNVGVLFVCVLLSLGFLLNACAPAEISTRRGLRASEIDAAGNAVSETAARIELLSLTETVSGGDVASISVRGEPGELYAVAVHYSSGVSKAKGLEPAVADADGVVAWSWKIGAKTAPGTYEIVVTGGGKTLNVSFTVQ